MRGDQQQDARERVGDDAGDARFEALAAATDDAVVVVDAANQVCFANAAAARLFEAPGGLVGQGFPLALRGLAPGTTGLMLASGRRLRLIATVTATLWRGRVAWLGTFKPQPALASELAPLVDEALARMRGRFLQHISHELRTPLNSIVGFAELMALESFGTLGNTPDASARYRSYAEDIRDSGTRLDRLVGDLLDLARAESGDLVLDEERFELGSLLAEVLPEAAAQARGGSATPKLGGFQPMIVAGDRTRLKRALVHLVANGLSFAGSGDVTVTVTRGRDGRARIGVRDHGPGFSDDALARASQPFARAREVERADPRAGLGVGLAVARHLIELHGGELAIASRTGRGATVTATLPRHRVGRPASAPRVTN